VSWVAHIEEKEEKFEQGVDMDVPPRRDQG